MRVEFVTRRVVVSLLAGFGMSVAPSLAAVAQTATPPADPDLRQAADLLFKRMLLKPNDLDASFQYSQIETKLGDYEAAIGALERMLFYNPNLPRVKLELGVLYFRLRSYEMARSYFNAAVSGADTPRDVRDEVAPFLAEIDRNVATNQFSIFAQGGLTYQTNANAGPDNPVVQALGQNALLSSQFQRTPDWATFGLLTAHYFYDFGDQNADGWQSDLTTYYARQFKVGRLNLALIEASTGPRLGLGATGVSVHPYVLGNALNLGGSTYLGTWGAGSSLRLRIPMGVTLDPGVEFRQRQFSNSASYPNASGQNGGQWIGYLIGTGQIAAITDLSWQGRLAVTDATASYQPYAYDDVSVDLSLPYAFAAPAFAQTGRPWSAGPLIGFSRTAYRRPDPIVNPLITRVDQQWRVGGSLDMTYLTNIGFGVQLEYLNTRSTVSNYRTSDFVVSLGPTFRF